VVELEAGQQVVDRKAVAERRLYAVERRRLLQAVSAGCNWFWHRQSATCAGTAVPRQSALAVRAQVVAVGTGFAAGQTTQRQQHAAKTREPAANWQAVNQRVVNDSIVN